MRNAEQSNVQSETVSVHRLWAGTLKAAVFRLVLVVFIMGWFYGRLAQAKQEVIENRRPAVESLKLKRDQLKAALDAKKRMQEIVDQYTEWMQERFAWTDLITELRNALEQTEASTRRPGMRTAVWVGWIPGLWHARQ